MKNVLLVMGFYLSSMHRLHKGVVEYAQKNGWHLSISKRQLPEYWRGDGILISYMSYDFLKRNQGIPVVSFSNWEKELDLTISTVREDDVKIGKIAAQHFIENGCKQACWYGDKLLYLRGRSFLRTMRHNGVDPVLIIPSQEQRESPWDIKNNWLAEQLLKLPLPCCIFCENDLWAYEVLEAALLIDLKVPEDIVILGVDNDSLLCESLVVPISSIDNRLEKVGFEGAALLDEIMNEKKHPGEIVLVPPASEVVVRKSTDVLSVEHPVLKRAVTYIKNHFDSSISVSKLAKIAFTSESGLRQLFKMHLNVSPLHLIHKLRIEKACKLLRETNLKIDMVAREAGFNDTKRFYDIFRKRMHLSPAKFRKEQSYPTT